MQNFKLLLCCALLNGTLVFPVAGSVILDFSDESDYVDNFTQASSGGVIGWNSGGYVQASGGNVGVAAQYDGADNFLTETISMTFQVGAAQAGQVGLYARIRDDGGAVRAFAAIGRSGTAANGSYFNLNLNYGGANYVLNSSTGTNFYTTVDPVYLGRYLLDTDTIVLTLEQQAGTNPQFKLSLAINGIAIVTTGWQTLANTGFNADGGVGMFFRPNTLSTIDVSSFAVIPEPQASLLILGGLGALLLVGARLKGKIEA